MAKIVSKSAKETQKIALLLAEEIKKTRQKNGATMIALKGNLGAGKTTFVQGFMRSLGVKEKVLSPTFVLMKIYNLRCRPSAARCFPKHLVHIDCYRIDSPKELEHLGLKEIFKDKDAIVLIEWAERIKKILPRNTIWLRFLHGPKSNERTIVL